MKGNGFNEYHRVYGNVRVTYRTGWNDITVWATIRSDDPRLGDLDIVEDFGDEEETVAEAERLVRERLGMTPRFTPTAPSALTAGALAHAARTSLWPPALALANTFAGPSVAEWAAAYVEATACLCGSAGWPDFEVENYVNRAAEAVGVALTDADRDTLAEATREAEAAGLALAAEYDVGMRRRR